MSLNTLVREFDCYGYIASNGQSNVFNSRTSKKAEDELKRLRQAFEEDEVQPFELQSMRLESRQQKVQGTNLHLN